MSLLSETKQLTPVAKSGEDFENCKGQCGYTQWCRACMEETKKRIREAEMKESDHDDERYT